MAQKKVRLCLLHLQNNKRVLTILSIDEADPDKGFPRALVIYEWERREEDEMSVYFGELIVVYEQDPSGWYIMNHMHVF